jgi:hydroxymethylglutaryl-CoA reductase (NADPH)
MSRAPVVKLPSAKRAADLKTFVEAAANFENLASIFNKEAAFCSFVFF